MDAAPPGYRTVIGATSLIVGPALMSVGDLFHPAETHAAADQVAIVVQSASRWYTAQSAEIFGALVPGLLAFFVGTALSVMSLVSAGDPFRWPAVGFALGAILILGEIILAKVVLSQIGNLLILVAGIAFAWLLLLAASPESSGDLRRGIGEAGRRSSSSSRFVAGEQPNMRLQLMRRSSARRTT